MPSTQEFRRRIKSVNNTKQITKAMEMIASIKMQKSIRTINQARSYIQNAWNILHMITQKALPEDHPLVNENMYPKTAIILITSDRGLCGSYNAEVIKKYLSFVKEIKNSSANAEVDVIAIGKVGAAYVKNYNIGNLMAEFKAFENDISIEDVLPIAKLSTTEFLNGHYGKIVIIYSHFVSSLKQTPVTKQLLPIIEEHIDQPELWEAGSKDRHDAIASRDDSNKSGTVNNNGVIASEQPFIGDSAKQSDLDIKFEPSPQAVIDGVLNQILRVQLLGAILEANASEHSARMVAMKNATDNANGLIDELTLIYNSVRQANITKEIAEIAGAAEAMK